MPPSQFDVLWSDLRSLPMLLPPYGQQRAIADFLNTETARIDALVVRKRLLLKVLEEHRDRCLDKVALPGLGIDSRSRPSDPPQREEVPSNYAIVPLGHLLKRITYGFTNPMPVNDVGPYMLTANDISDGRILYETARRTTDEAFRTQLTPKSRPVPGDILLTKDGSLGRVALFDGTPACVNQSVAVLSPNVARVMPELLALLLAVPAYRDALIFEAGGTTIKHLYISRVTKQLVAIPPPSEQPTLLKALVEVRGAHIQVIERLQRSIELLQERRQALITAAVTGQLHIPRAAA
jgi:type I restriction enzyme S subunit